MDKSNYRKFEFGPAIKLHAKIESLAKEGKIERIYPLIEGVDTKIHVYKSEGFDIGTYHNGIKEIIEFSRYSNFNKSIDEKISEIGNLIKMKFE